MAGNAQKIRVPLPDANVKMKCSREANEPLEQEIRAFSRFILAVYSPREGVFRAGEKEMAQWADLRLHRILFVVQ